MTQSHFQMRHLTLLNFAARSDPILCSEKPFRYQDVEKYYQWMLTQQLRHLSDLEVLITDADQEIARRTRPFEEARTLLASIPGVQGRVADVILAEVGPTVEPFRTAAASFHLSADLDRAGPGRTSHCGSSAPIASRRRDLVVKHYARCWKGTCLSDEGPDTQADNPLDNWYTPINIRAEMIGRAVSRNPRGMTIEPGYWQVQIKCIGSVRLNNVPKFNRWIPKFMCTGTR